MFHILLFKFIVINGAIIENDRNPHMIVNFDGSVGAGQKLIELFSIQKLIFISAPNKLWLLKILDIEPITKASYGLSLTY